MEEPVEHWDLFISHAFEDKAEVARPLAEELRDRGLRVWYDEFSLTLGDSLRRSIDRGLANSRFGVVILSRHFFAKAWPQVELGGLVSRESSVGKVILPVWHKLTALEVARYSPILADRLAVTSELGIAALADAIEAVVRSGSTVRSKHVPTTPASASPELLVGTPSPHRASSRAPRNQLKSGVRGQKAASSVSQADGGRKPEGGGTGGYTLRKRLGAVIPAISRQQVIWFVGITVVVMLMIIVELADRSRKPSSKDKADVRFPVDTIGVDTTGSAVTTTPAATPVAFMDSIRVQIALGRGYYNEGRYTDADAVLDRGLQRLRSRAAELPDGRRRALEDTLTSLRSDVGTACRGENTYANLDKPVPCP